MRKIVEWPAEVLETRAADVTEFNDDLKSLVADMHETMKASRGIGLAANQVGVLQRVLVIHIPWHPSEPDEEPDNKRPWHDKAYTFVNPEIIRKDGKVRYQEGCLSFPEIFEFVDRADEVTVRAYDQDGKSFEVEADGLFSICLQHEIDHIDGIVFVDRMSRLKSGLVKKRMRKRNGTMDAEPSL